MDDVSIRHNLLNANSPGSVALSNDPYGFSRVLYHYFEDGVQAKEVDGLTLAIGSKFGVDINGKVYLSDASMSGSINATGGKIGGFNIDSDALTKGNDLIISPSVIKIGLYEDTELLPCNFCVDTNIGKAWFTSDNHYYHAPGYDFDLDNGRGFYVSSDGTSSPGLNYVRINYDSILCVTPYGITFSFDKEGNLLLKGKITDTNGNVSDNISDLLQRVAQLETIIKYGGGA